MAQAATQQAKTIQKLSARLSIHLCYRAKDLARLACMCSMRAAGYCLSPPTVSYSVTNSSSSSSPGRGPGAPVVRVRRAARRRGRQRRVAAAVRGGVWGRRPCGGHRRRARLEVPVPQVGSRGRTTCSLLSHLACAARCCYCMSVRLASVSLSQAKRATGCRGAALQSGTPSTVNNEWRL